MDKTSPPQPLPQQVWRHHTHKVPFSFVRTVGKLKGTVVDSRKTPLRLLTNDGT